MYHKGYQRVSKSIFFNGNVFLAQLISDNGKIISSKNWGCKVLNIDQVFTYTCFITHWYDIYFSTYLSMFHYSLICTSVITYPCFITHWYRLYYLPIQYFSTYLFTLNFLIKIKAYGNNDITCIFLNKNMRHSLHI